MLPLLIRSDFMRGPFIGEEVLGPRWQLIVALVKIAAVVT
jgi:hypothetical protein